MSKLKNNIDNITGDTEKIVKDYLRLAMVKLTERLALFFGILATVFLLVTLILIVVVIGSVALSGFLNDVLESKAAGYWIVAGVYLLFIGILVIRMFRSKAPLFSNLLVKLIVFVLGADVKHDGSLHGLKQEQENIHEQLDAHKDKIKTDIQLLRYTFLESLLKEFLGMFTTKKKAKAGKTREKTTKARKTRKSTKPANAEKTPKAEKTDPET